MSYVNLIIIKNEKVYFASMHYRKAQELLRSKVALNVFIAGKTGHYLDAGYLIYDVDSGEVINRQLAFLPMQA